MSTALRQQGAPVAIGLVAYEPEPRAETSDPAQRDAGRDAPLFIQTQHGLGRTAAAHALTLTEVRAERETFFGYHRWPQCYTRIFSAAASLERQVFIDRRGADESTRHNPGRG